MGYRKLLAFEPYDYQTDGIKFSAIHHYCLIADEMGLGKTLQALTNSFRKVENGGKILIVCPAFLRLNWFFEIDKFSNHFYEVHLVEEGKELHTMPETTDIVIVSYAQVQKAEHLFDWADMVIADEAHKLKNMEAKVTLAFHQFVYEYVPDRLVLMTGTPIPNGVIEYYSLLRLLGYTPRPTNGLNVYKDFPVPEDFYQTFAHEVQVRIRTKTGRRITLNKYEGLKNKAQLLPYLKDKVIRRRAKDVLDLPPSIPKNIIVAYGNDPKLLKEFNQFNSEGKGDSSAKAKSALLKAPFTAEYAKNLNEKGLGPIVIYTDHVKSCELMAQKLDCPFIHGAVNTTKRNQYIKELQAGKLDYLVITIGAGAEGLTLTKSNQMILNDLNWIPTKNDQVLHRIKRIGQLKTAFFHFMIGSIQDKKIAENLKKKMRVIRELVE